MFYFSLGPMFLAAYLRDWGLIAFDILTVNRHDKIVVPLTRAVARLQNKTRQVSSR